MKRKSTWKWSIYLVAISAVVLWSGYSAQAATVTVSEDTYVSNYSSYVNSNFGDSDILVSGTWVSTPMRIERTYLKFDLSSLPTDKVVTSATLWGYYYRDLGFSSPNPDLEHTLYVVGDYLNDGTTPWTEENLNWTNHSTVAGTYLGNWTPPSTGKVWQSWTVTNAVKAEYLGDRAISIMIAATNEGVIKSAEEFLSKEARVDLYPTTYGADAGPFYLDITLADAPIGVPEPATLLLLGLGLFGLTGIRGRK